MNNTPTKTVSILVVCRPGLNQKSLFTAVNAIPLAKVVGKADGADSALRLARQLKPDVLLADANSLQDESLPLLKQAKDQLPEMIRVVLIAMTAPAQKARLLQEGADFVLDDGNLDREFTRILRNIEATSL